MDDRLKRGGQVIVGAEFGGMRVLWVFGIGGLMSGGQESGGQ